jgi:hypothetical protein
LKITRNSVDSGRSHLSSLRIIDSSLICPMKGQAETRRQPCDATCDTKIEHRSGKIVPNAASAGKTAVLFIGFGSWGSSQCLLNAFNQFIRNIGTVNSHDAFLCTPIAQQIDATIPHNLLVHDCKFLVDI